MNSDRKARLEAAGFRTGTVAEFLCLSPAEMAMIETRRALTAYERDRRPGATPQDVTGIIGQATEGVGHAPPKQ